MARRVVDVSMIQGLVEKAENQEVQLGTPRTTDRNFPVFATPVNRDILVYIPRTNVTTNENGEYMKVLDFYMHSGRNGKSFVNLRCMNNLSGPPFDQLGYDGSCPACEAMQDVWELYREKLKIEADRLGIDPQNDPQDVLKPSREKILKEMDLQNSEEYVIFPIVIIPTEGRMKPAEDAMENMEVVFVHWRKKRYNDAILGGLDSLMVNPGHPAGLFWYWKFSYDTGGKQPTAMLSANNATYTVIQEQSALDMFEKFKQVAEAKAAKFTITKAAEVVVAAHFLYKEDLDAEVNKVVQKTRQSLDLMKLSGGKPALPNGQQPAVALNGGNPLANFGVAQQASDQPANQAPQAPQGGSVGFGAPPATLSGQATPPVGNPVQFGQ